MTTQLRAADASNGLDAYYTGRLAGDRAAYAIAEQEAAAIGWTPDRLWNCWREQAQDLERQALGLPSYTGLSLGQQSSANRRVWDVARAAQVKRASQVTANDFGAVTRFQNDYHRVHGVWLGYDDARRRVAGGE